MTPAVMTHNETLEWIRGVTGRVRVRLPKGDAVMYVDQPGGGQWKVRPYISGSFLVSPVIQKAEGQ